MPPPRRQPPPPGESKTGLVVALVVFVLLTIINGALAYMFNSENAAATKAAADARAAESTAKKNRDQQELRRILLAQFVGAATPEDVNALSTLKGDTSTYAAELTRLNVELGTAGTLGANGVQWDPAGEKPVETLKERVAKMATQMAGLQTNFQTATTEFAATTDNLTKSADSFRAGQTAAQAKQQQAGQAELDAKAAKAKEYTDALALIAKQREQVAQLQKDLESAGIESAKQINALKKTIDEKDSQVRKLMAQLDLKRDDILATDQPKGRITRVDNRAGLAWVNIGSADFARPNLTFSIVAPGSGGAAGKRERKGALEIVKVLGDKLSQARITDVTNPLQDPILEGDLLFNPAWDPSQKMRVAIAGHIDFNGDRLDDTPELVRTLEKGGIQVDAHVDLREATIKGEGVSVGTNYLILGDTPQSDAGAGGSEREKKIGDIRARVQDMKDQAARAGVPVVKWRDFLKMMGMPISRTPSVPDFTPPGTIKAVEGPRQPAKKDDAKKDDAKKDDEGKEGK